MQRRRFLVRASQALAALGALPSASGAKHRQFKAIRLHLQDCRIAGSHQYDCHPVLPDLQADDPLQLGRQFLDLRDEGAIEILWRDRKLDYLPQLDTASAASLLDCAHALPAEILGTNTPTIYCCDKWHRFATYKLR